MTATRWPDRSAPWSQRAEWQIVPRNRASPSMPGLAGSDRLPEPVDDRVGGQFAGGGPDLPALPGLLPAGVEHFFAELGDLVHAQAAGDLPGVGLDLGSAGEGARPVRVRGERQRVQVGRHVAGDARVAVVPPGAADLGGALQHHKIIDARVAQGMYGGQPGEAGADDRHPHVQAARRAGGRAVSHGGSGGAAARRQELGHGLLALGGGGNVKNYNMTRVIVNSVTGMSDQSGATAGPRGDPDLGMRSGAVRSGPPPRARVILEGQMTTTTAGSRARQQRSRRTVRQILDAAGQIVGTQGVDAAATRAIAERGGVAIPSLYRFFADRDEILDALAEHMTADLDQHARAAEAA